MSNHSDFKKISKTFVPEIGCVGKVAFKHRSDAMVVVNRTGRSAPRGRTAYSCGICGMWHIGSDQFGLSKQRTQSINEKRHGL
jgi:hypothetical protein